MAKRIVFEISDELHMRIHIKACKKRVKVAHVARELLEKWAKK